MDSAALMLTLMWWLGSIVRPVSHWHQHVVMFKSSWSASQCLCTGRARGSGSCQDHLSNTLQVTKCVENRSGSSYKKKFSKRRKMTEKWKQNMRIAVCMESRKLSLVVRNQPRTMSKLFFSPHFCICFLNTHIPLDCLHHWRQVFLHKHYKSNLAK